MISILLAAYNGEKYITEQIESLLGQTVQDFKLFIRDDRSADSTFSIITDYAARYPDKISVVQNETNLGTFANFMQMMIEHKDDYVMLCDQDDVWLPNKIEITLAKMRATETEYGMETPLAVRTDVRVVDEHLATVSPSSWHFGGINYRRTKLCNLLAQNVLGGCAAMYNRALAGLITQMPEISSGGGMTGGWHDWWLALTASAFGRIESVKEQTVLYRQHSKNVIGAQNVHSFRYMLGKLLNHRAISQSLNNSYLLAQCFYSVYENRLTAEQKEQLTLYADIPNVSKPARWIRICRLDAWKHGLARRIAQLIFI